MKFGKALMYVNILEPTQRKINNLIHVMLTLNHTCYPVSINNVLERKIIFQKWKRLVITVKLVLIGEDAEL